MKICILSGTAGLLYMFSESFRPRGLHGSCLQKLYCKEGTCN